MRSLIAFLLLFACISVYGQTENSFTRYSHIFSGHCGYDFIPLANRQQMHIGAYLNKLILMKSDSSAQRIWAKEIVTGASGIRFDQLEVCTNHSFFLLGWRYLNLHYKTVLAKADTAGNILWTKQVTADTINYDRKIIRTLDNNFLLLLSDSLKMVLIKLDSSGAFLWNKQFLTNSGGRCGLTQLPDSSIVLTGSIKGAIPVYPYFSTAPLLMKLDKNGNTIWSKNLYFFIPPNFPGTQFAWSGDEIFYTSAKEFILIEGRRTIRLDSTGNVINSKSLLSATQLRIISENPLGRLNFGSLGGPTNDNMGFDEPELIRTSLSIDSISATVYRPPGLLAVGPDHYFWFWNVKQLPDKRVGFTGMTENHENGWSIVLTDSSGYQSCTSAPGGAAFSSDTNLHSNPIIVQTAAGVAVSALNITTIPFQLPYCNCDSIPKARFGYTSAGTTFTFLDSSTNATSWVWNFGDNSYDTVQNPIHTYTVNQPRDIVLVAKNNCGMDTYYLHYDPVTHSTSTNASDGNILLYPNPASETLTIEYTNAGIVEITDMLGRLQKTVVVPKGMSKLTVSVNELVPGVYNYVFIKDNVESHMGKVVIIR